MNELTELKLSKADAIKMYPKAEEWVKIMLEKSFTKECFSGDITDRIKTFADVCFVANTTEEAFNNKFKHLDLDTIAYEKLKLIIKVLNEDWTPDFNNSNQQKWYNWFNLSSGFGFDGSFCNYGDANTAVGVRLCLKSEKLATYAATQFLQEYKEYLT